MQQNEIRSFYSRVVKWIVGKITYFKILSVHVRNFISIKIYHIGREIIMYLENVYAVFPFVHFKRQFSVN